MKGFSKVFNSSKLAFYFFLGIFGLPPLKKRRKENLENLGLLKCKFD
jgi:hypothetical protein